jgi:hypothetical protein
LQEQRWTCAKIIDPIRCVWHKNRVKAEFYFARWQITVILTASIMPPREHSESPVHVASGGGKAIMLHRC